MPASPRSRRFGPVTLAAALPALATASMAFAQAVGPDMANTNFGSISRFGTDAAGTTTAYAIGSTACNRGDQPAVVLISSPLTRIIIAQNIFRLKTDVSGRFQRFEQVGQGWMKHVNGPIQTTNSTCGTCQNGGSGRMGVNCADPYGSGLNGSQSLLGPRSTANPQTGYFTVNPGGSTGDATVRGRIQVPTVDVVAQPAGTRFFAETVIYLPDDAQYVRPGQTVAFNAMNNASVQEININGGTANPTLTGSGTLVEPALARWRAIDPAVTLVNVDHDETPNPSAAFPNTFLRSRYVVAVKTTPLTDGAWRYEYAVFNLNSHRGAGSFSLPLPGTASFRDFTFRHPRSHSGEPFANDAWTATRSGDTLTFAAAPFASNPNANAIRFATTYNFGFTTNAAPVTGAGSIALFKPGTVASLAVPGLPVPNTPPAPACVADFDRNGIVTPDDLDDFITCYFNAPPCPAADINENSVMEPGDIDEFITTFFEGC
ncbi:MAG: hypothetical protein ACT4PL_10775 [Phycisphaerales bacterium]